MARPMRASMLAEAVLPLVGLMSCGGSQGDGAHPSAPDAAAPVTAAAAAPAARATDAARPTPEGSAARGPVATVNGSPITFAKVESVYRTNKSMLERRGRTLSEADDRALRRQSLEAVVADELLHQAAVAKGVKIAPSEVDTALKQIKLRAGSEAAYAKLVEQSGLTDAGVYKEVERNLRIETFRKNLVAGKGVSEADARKYYAENAPKGVFNLPERVHVQYILVKVAEGAAESERADARKRAEEAARRGAAGEDFSALAQQYSQDPTASRGGDIGFIPRGVMPPKFEEVAFASKPGDVSAAFEMPKGFSVIKVLEKKPVSTRSYDEVKSALLLEMGRLMEQDIVGAKVRELATAGAIAILDPSFAGPAPSPEPAPQPSTKR